MFSKYIVQDVLGSQMTLKSIVPITFLMKRIIETQLLIMQSDKIPRQIIQLINVIWGLISWIDEDVFRIYLKI